MLYPLKFKPVLKAPLWAGRGIVELKHLQGYATVGESWEISGVPGDETVVTEGPLAGKTLRQLIEQYEAELIGLRNFKRYGTEFPLLIKFISADDALSIQVHPDDAMAWRHGKPFGKTEMWYIVKAEQNATLYSGFNHSLTPEEYDRIMEDGTLTEHMAEHKTEVGDCFFIPAGQIHSIGKGNLLVEVQQSSDLTYRVFDFNRRDSEGNLRELHTALAREALNFKVPERIAQQIAEGNKVDYRTPYTNQTDSVVELERHPEFTTSVLHLTHNFERDLRDIDSFVIYVCYEGQACLKVGSHTTTLQAGESILLPACCKDVIFEIGSDTPFSAIETYV